MEYNINNMLPKLIQTDNSLGGDSANRISQEDFSRGAVNGTDGAETLKQLSVGDVFRAKILDIRNTDVRILLSNHQEVHAKMGEALELNIGQEINFQVKANGENGIVLRPIGNSEIPSELINKSLLSAGISINDKNTAIVKELIQNGQPIDRQSVLNMVKLINTYKGEDIDKLIRMMKHGIEITQENLEQYDKYAGNQYKITDSLKQLSDGLAHYLANESDGELKPVIQLLRELSQVMDGSNNRETLRNISDAFRENPEMVGKQPETSANNPEIVGKQPETSADNPGAVPKQPEMFPNTPDMVHDRAELLRSKLEMFPEDSELFREDMKAADNIQELKPTGEEIISAQNHILQNSNQNRNIETIHSSVEEKQNTIVNDIKLSKSFQELADNLNRIMEQNYSKEEIIRILQNSDFHKTVKNLFREKNMLNISKGTDEVILDKRDINNLYVRLLQAADVIEKNIKGDNPRENNLLNQAKDMRDNIMFMNELNQITSYVQIPYRINTRHEHGDLYVYGKKRSKTEETEKITAFLHLDLDYLGATDISVELLNQSVSTKFSLDNRISEKIVEEHLEELAKRLEKKGYTVHLSAETVLPDKFLESGTSEAENKCNVLDNIFEHDEKASGIKRYTFDIRT